MATHYHLIDSLCAQSETRQNARNLYLQAAQRTGQGSGHSLGLGHNALPTICAFLASERLGNGDVTKDQARARACVDAKTFDATLGNVERIVPSSSSTGVNIRSITRESLVQLHGVREDAVVPMLEVEVALNKSAKLDDFQIDPESNLVRCGVFHWVCTRVLSVGLDLDVQSFRQQFELSQRKWTTVQTLLERHCSHMVRRLAQQAETAAMASATRTTRSQTRSQKRTPNKEIFAASSNNFMLFPGDDNPAPQKSGVVSRMKRNASTEPRSQEFKSPSKRPKDGSYAQSTLGQDLSMHTPKARRGNAAASTTPSRNVTDRVSSSIHDDDVEEMSTETIVVRSTRASHRHLDVTAWNAERPTNAVALSKQHPSAPSTHFTPLCEDTASTPMTSTGMSDVSSSGSPSRGRASRAQTRAHFRSSSRAAMSRSSPLIEEMPRRRRRNLRAPFLDRDAYVWKPSARTARILDRARKWEALMVDKYGDPWDDL